MDDNGTGNGGGNGSVWWGMTHGSDKTGIRPPQLANPVRMAASSSGVQEIGKAGSAATLDEITGPPGPGRVKLGIRAEGHDATPFDEIGKPDHPGMFRVRLRFRTADLAAGKFNISPAQRELIERYAKPDPSLADDSVFLEIDVPAIRRDPPKRGDDWPYMPWEIHWGW